jgi:hypothetical protein
MSRARTGSHACPVAESTWTDLERIAERVARALGPSRLFQPENFP